jgi:hypothetical protein
MIQFHKIAGPLDSVKRSRRFEASKQKITSSSTKRADASKLPKTFGIFTRQVGEQLVYNVSLTARIFLCCYLSTKVQPNSVKIELFVLSKVLKIYFSYNFLCLWS